MGDRSARSVVAAGGVVWRARDGAPDVLVVHRPRYDDWTLPKGVVRPGEHDLLAAVREVREETGAEVAVQRRIATVRYPLGERRKKVTYWSMRWLAGDFAPNDEVDRVEWLRVGQAYRRLTYDTDRGVLADYASMPVPDALLVLVRHARAGRRADWRGEDRLRPLDPIGRQQAQQLAALLSTFAPTEIRAADLVRCESTVAPLAASTGLSLALDPAFADENFDSGRDGTALTLLSLAKPGNVAVVCSQGTTIPALVDRLGPGVRSSDTRKGAWWVLPVVDGDVIVADRYDPPPVAVD